jgi:MFS family permease
MQNVLSYSAFEAGLGQTPAAVMFVVVARFAAGWLPRSGARGLILIGSACFVAGFGWLSQADAGSSYVYGVLGPTLLVAAGIGLVFPTLMAAATADVPPGEAGIIAGLANTASQVGSSVALAVYATVASARATAEGSGHSPTALAAGYGQVFLLAVGVGLVIAAVSLLLPRHRHS